MIILEPGDAFVVIRQDGEDLVLNPSQIEMELERAGIEYSRYKLSPKWPTNRVFKWVETAGGAVEYHVLLGRPRIFGRPAKVTQHIVYRLYGVSLHKQEPIPIGAWARGKNWKGEKFTGKILSHNPYYKSIWVEVSPTRRMALYGWEIIE